MARFRGTTSDCTRDYGGRYNVTEGLGFMAEFTGVVASTALGWVRGENIPTGDTLLKLRCFLHIVGYQVEEFIELPKPTRHFAEIVSLGVLTVEESAKLLGYRNTQDLYSVLLRNRGLLADKVHRLSRIVEENDEQRRALLDEWRTRLGSSGMSVRGSEESNGNDPGGEVPNSAPPSPVVDLPLAVKLFLQNVGAAALLLHCLQSDDGSWEEVARQMLDTEPSVEGLAAWLSTPSGEAGG